MSPKSQNGWPKPLADSALIGLAGDVVNTITPESEADPVAVLITFLVAVGSVVGRGPGFEANREHHGTNLFAVIVGATGDAKGMSRVGYKPVEIADPTWKHTSGLSSGEGLIYHVRDATMGVNKDEEVTIEDPGVEDKRLMVVETEFSNCLTVMERPQNNLSPVIRRAWDGDSLSVLTKNSPLKSTGAHVSVIAHVTDEELKRRLSRTDAFNGFANRFLWVCAKRSKELPTGGNLSDADLYGLAERTKDAITFAEGRSDLDRTAKAENLWAQVYPKLSNGSPGLLGAVTARARPQVARLSVIYALLDESPKVYVPHLKAGIAVWRYCAASAAYIFGRSLGDTLADSLFDLLSNAGEEGMSNTEITNATGRHKTKEELGAALKLLEDHGRARHARIKTSGRPYTRWWSV